MQHVSQQTWDEAEKILRGLGIHCVIIECRNAVLANRNIAGFNPHMVARCYLRQLSKIAFYAEWEASQS